MELNACPQHVWVALSIALAPCCDASLHKACFRAQVWEQTGQLRSESTGAALTESEVAAELASVSDEELLLAMQV